MCVVQCLIKYYKLILKQIYSLTKQNHALLFFQLWLTCPSDNCSVGAETCEQSNESCVTVSKDFILCLLSIKINVLLKVVLICYIFI